MVDLWRDLEKPVSNLMLVWIILMGVYVSQWVHMARPWKACKLIPYKILPIDKFFINKIKNKNL